MKYLKYFAWNAGAIIVAGFVIQLCWREAWHALDRDVGGSGAVIVTIFFQVVTAFLSLPGQLVAAYALRPFVLRPLESVAAALLVTIGAIIGVGAVISGPVHSGVPSSLIAAWSLVVYVALGLVSRWLQGKPVRGGA